MATDVAAPVRATTWQQVKALAASPMAPFYFIAASVAVLTGLGLLMVLSASSVIALDRGVGPFYYLGKQAGALAVGLVGAVALAVLPPEALRRMGWLAWAIAVLLLGLVLTPLGTEQLGRGGAGVARLEDLVLDESRVEAEGDDVAADRREDEPHRVDALTADDRDHHPAERAEQGDPGEDRLVGTAGVRRLLDGDRWQVRIGPDLADLTHRCGLLTHPAAPS